MDRDFSTAQAFGVLHGRFVSVGTTDNVLAQAGPATKRVDLKGRTVVPGLIDTHNHMQWTAIQTRLVDLAPARSIADVQDAIRAYAQRHPHKPWIMSGSGWHVVSLREGRYPTRQELDAA